MDLPVIYQALSDPTRLRVLNLLAVTPLCVQHLQVALEAPQVMVSKHLILLKASGLVESQKIRNWRLYRLPAKPSLAIRKNTECLLACIRDEQLFQDDVRRLQPLRPQIQQLLKQPAKPQRVPKPRPSAATQIPAIGSPISSPSDSLEEHLL
jgi:DNA-binding transcriptional ArsR family regulator